MSTIIVTPSTPPPATNEPCYLTLPQADALAAALLNLTAWASATSPRKLAALVEATQRVDRAFRWQGRTVEDGQALAFPRVVGTARDRDGVVGRVVTFGDSRVGRFVDADPETGEAVVPTAVLRAVLVEADAILAGDGHNARRQERDGLTTQSVGGALEVIKSGSGSEGPALTVRARDLVRPYRLTTGNII